MQPDPPETSELAAFVAVAAAGSVSAGALELRVPRATISRRLARLEERLGARLMHRTTRQLRLTEAGEELFGHARAILQTVDAAVQAVHPEDSLPRGLLRVSLPPSDNLRVAGMLIDFAERFPKVELEVMTTTLHEDLVARNIDVALRAGRNLDPGLMARQLAVADVLAVASPRYLASAGHPADAGELAGRQCLVGFARGERPATHWPLRDGGQVRVGGRIISNDLALLTAAALRGLGIALLPRVVCQAALDAGALTPVLPGVVGATSVIALVYPDRRLLKPATRAFIEHAVAWSATWAGAA